MFSSDFRKVLLAFRGLQPHESKSVSTSGELDSGPDMDANAVVATWLGKQLIRVHHIMERYRLDL